MKTLHHHDTSSSQHLAENSLASKGELVPVGAGDSIPLLREVLIAGRRESCDIYLPFPSVSSRHCQLSFNDGFWYATDMGSTNGTKINGVHLTDRKLLKPGDLIEFAKTRFRIRYVLPLGKAIPEETPACDEIMGKSLLEKAGLSRSKRP